MTPNYATLDRTVNRLNLSIDQDRPSGLNQLHNPRLNRDQGLRV